MRERARLGMAMFLVNEGVFFFLLIAAFVYFRSATLAAAAGALRLGPAAVYTACLLASSCTMRGAQRGKPARARIWMGATMALGGVFLLGQGREYLRLFHQNVTIGNSLFGTTFFTLTGLHGLHVAAGIALLGILLAPAGDSSERQSVAIDTAALYWYFVDAVWIAIFVVLYLWTLL